MFSFGDYDKLKNDPEKNRVGIALDKGAILKGLLEDAEAAGVEIFPGTNVTGIETGESGVVVTGNGEPFEGSFVIAADGINSRIARLMGMNKERKFIATMVDRVWNLELGFFILRNIEKKTRKSIGKIEIYDAPKYTLMVEIQYRGSYWEPPSYDWKDLHSSGEFLDILHLGLMEVNRLKFSEYCFEAKYSS